jgi:hypothetical protein
MELCIVRSWCSAKVEARIVKAILKVGMVGMYVDDRVVASLTRGWLVVLPSLRLVVFSYIQAWHGKAGKAHSYTFFCS